MSSPQSSAQNSSNQSTKIDVATGLGAHFHAAYPRLVMVAAGMIGHREDAEDIVQQAVGIALEKNEQFADPAGLIAWLAGVVRHCALNYYRKQRVRKTFPADPADFSQLPGDKAPVAASVHPQTGEIAPEQHAFDDHVLAALQELSADARCCLLLRTVEKLNYAEIGQLLQIPEGTAMSHVHRSRRKLRAKLAAYAADPALTKKQS